MKLNYQNELIEFIKIIDNIDYLVHGSFAYNLYTNENLPISDIDIILCSNDFKTITTRLSEHGDKYRCYASANNIHVNSKHIKGTDGKAFDISLDSYEHYFQNIINNIHNYEIFEIDGMKIKVVTLGDLIKIYSYSASQNSKKQNLYEDKYNKLDNFASSVIK